MGNLGLGPDLTITHREGYHKAGPCPGHPTIGCERLLSFNLRVTEEQVKTADPKLWDDIVRWVKEGTYAKLDLGEGKPVYYCPTEIGVWFIAYVHYN